MDSWLNPLPAETVLGAIIGAVLGSILERNDYLNITSWLNSGSALLLILLILAFGVLLHFYCAACHLQKDTIRRWSLFGCILAIAGMLFAYPKHLGIGPDASIIFLPHEYNALMSGVLILWLISLRALTQLKRIMAE